MRVAIFAPSRETNEMARVYERTNRAMGGIFSVAVFDDRSAAERWFFAGTDDEAR